MSLDLATLPDEALLTRVMAEPGTRAGRKALKVELSETALKGQAGVDFTDAPTFVHLPCTLKNGTIEVDVLGRLNGKGPTEARAFIGLAYRVSTDGLRYESIYLRPLNGRKTNPPPPRDKRAVQYYAYPDWNFERLRKEYPDGRYEAGADIAAEEWITLKIELDDVMARAIVNGRLELAISEAKAAPIAGGIGLWVERGTEGYFSNLRVTPR